MLILNCSNILDKRFDIQSDNMKLFYDNRAVKSILEVSSLDYEIKNGCLKNQKEFNLDFDDLKENNILILVDFQDINQIKTLVSKSIRKIVMLVVIHHPFEIKPLEISLDIGVSIGYMHSSLSFGISICSRGKISAI